MELKHTKLFKLEEEYVIDSHEFIETLNEGMFDRILSLFKKLSDWFKHKEEVKKEFDEASNDINSDKTNFQISNIKRGEEIVLKLVNPKSDADEAFIGLLKVGELPDKSTIFQLTGTTSDKLLLNLVNSKVMEDLIKNNVMVIVSNQTLEYGKPLQVKILKSITKQGGTYTTSSNISKVINKKDM